jgi:hypothetical protein
MERALKEMAEDYVLRLTGYFASNPKNLNTPGKP